MAYDRNITDSNYIPANDPRPESGIYLAEVVGHLDKTFMGLLEVRLLRSVGGEAAVGQTYPAKYLSPFYGATTQLATSQNDDFDSTQKSYGMWMIPPDVGNKVLVLFTSSDSKYGYWIGCVPEEGMNFMVPGIAASSFKVDGLAERVPVAEYNKKVNDGSIADLTKIKKPQHLLAEVLDTQGLLKDDIRGITTSSARREAPSSVFGISTPGPLDKSGPTTLVGRSDEKVSVPISRLGGTTFVMDDGDDKFLRRKPASEGPPEYARVEQGEQDGDKKIPHNELVRIRTRTGHQILMHNSEDLIYIGNSKGTTWIELTSNGKIDIYAKDSVSIHTENDLNIKADRDINLESGRNFNIKAPGRFQVESANTTLIADEDTKITSGANSHINSGTTHRETAGKIYMNSAQAAAKGIKLQTVELPTEAGASVNSIMARMPTHEPWPHHENLNPTAFLPAKTDREKGGSIPKPTAWNSYTTLNDTFQKLLPPNAKKDD